MSASATFFTSTQILSHEFINFVLSQNGFISNEANIDGGFSKDNSYVWFYGAKKTLNSQENEIEKNNMQLPLYTSSWIYFELSSAEGSHELMTDVFQRMGQLWPVSMRCSLYRIFNHNKFAALLQKERREFLLSNHITLFFAEDKLVDYLVDNTHGGMVMKDKEQDELMIALASGEVAKIININNFTAYVSVMYEYENNDNALTEALTKVLKKAPRFFCEIHFGYGLNTLAEKTLIFFLTDLLKNNNGVGMGIFESTLTPKDINSPFLHSYIKFA